jgi:hypothetical protein
VQAHFGSDMTKPARLEVGRTQGGMEILRPGRQGVRIPISSLVIDDAHDRFTARRDKAARCRQTAEKGRHYPFALTPHRRTPSRAANAASMPRVTQGCSLATFDITPNRGHLAPGPAGHRRRRAARRRQGCPLRAAHPRGCGGTSGRPITVRRCPAVVGADAPDG